MRRTALPLAASLALALLTLSVFQPVFRADFVDLDDNVNLTANGRVRAGLTWEGVRWAFGTTLDGNWIPLTWLSHMAVAEVFGMDPGRHHQVNVLLHTAGTVILFHGLRAATGAVWPSALASALFAVHPLHVESVAWVTERKDVLAGFFWMLAMLAHVRYAARPDRARYLATAVFFVLGLMSKPIVVVLPVVLLVLDWWPLGRFGPGGAGGRPAARGLLLEKVPLFILSLAVGAAAILTQQGTGAFIGLRELGLGQRLGIATAAAWSYLGRALRPAGLAVFYPYQGDEAWWWPAAALLAVTAVLALARRRVPCLAAGWAWYLAALLPVSGLLQAGDQAMADRYTYLPLAGIFIGACWWAARAARRPWARVPAIILSAAVLAALSLAARSQAGYWRDSAALFERTLAVTRMNYPIQLNYGLYLYGRGDLDGARIHLAEALAIEPRLSAAHLYLARILRREGRNAEAVEHLRRAAAIDERPGTAMGELGLLLAEQGSLDEAAHSLSRVLEENPRDGAALTNLGNVLAMQGRLDEAEVRYREALAVAPGDADAWNGLGNLMAMRGRMVEAENLYGTALRYRPDYQPARSNLDKLRGGGPGGGMNP